MSGKLSFGLFVVAAVVLGACGRQVTPNPPGLGAGGALPGYMTIKFDVAGQLNVSSYQYWVVLNTSGNGVTPLTNASQTNWIAYSSATEVAGSGGGTFATAIQFLKNSNPTIQPYPQHLITPPQQFQYIANSNGTGTEFSLTLQRAIFNNTSPSPSPSPLSQVWLFNAFVTQANVQNQLLFVDSMGQGGNTDTSFSSPQLNVNTCFDQTFYKLQDFQPPSDPAAQLVSVEIANNPSPGPHSSPCP